jgi:GntR family transcriptional regulator, arabinose operon transcriptional repressor
MLNAPTKLSGYRKIKGEIEGMIQRGVLTGGGLVPAERELARQLSASLGEVRLAVNKLAGEGKLVRIPRKGTFVTPRPGKVLAGQTPTWAVIVPLLKYFYPPILHTLEEEARSYGATINLGCSGVNADLERQLVLQAIEKGAEGILLAPARSLRRERDAGSFDYLEGLPVPIVIMDHWGTQALPSVGVDCVLNDNFAGCYQSTVHLIQHRHTKIGFFRVARPEQITPPEFIQRRKGYEAALADHGLAVPQLAPLWNWNIDHDPEPIRQYLEAGVSAFVLTDDTSAAKLLRLLNRWGIKVPEQVAVIGYDDEHMDEITDPPLSSVRVPKEEMARKAARLLQERIESKTKGNYRTILLRPTIVARQSCGNNCPLAKETENVPMELQVNPLAGVALCERK